MENTDENINWRQLLWPFSLLYGAITTARNRAFDYGILKSESFPLPVIAVGNLSTGGTGKTPAVEFILGELAEFKWGVVSRGYGRRTRGLLLPDQHSSALDIGDEPYQILHKFPQVAMALSEKRRLGISALLDKAAPEAILLDDAFQHRYVEASLYLLLTTYGQPFYNDNLLPAGNLRESIRGRKRAQVLLVSKCPPQLSVGDSLAIRERLEASPDQEVFFSSLSYDPARNEVGKILANGSRVELISGIANPRHFEEECKAHFEVEASQSFADHHLYRRHEIAAIEARLSQGSKILTTEKDWVRLKGMIDSSLWEEVYYLPVGMQILFNEKERLLRILREHIRRY